MIGHLGARVSALLDGQLSQAEADEAWAHVYACHACRDLVEREGWVKTRLAGLSGGVGAASPDLKGSLLSLTPGERFLVEPATRRRSPPRRRCRGPRRRRARRGDGRRARARLRPGLRAGQRPPPPGFEGRDADGERGAASQIPGQTSLTRPRRSRRSARSGRLRRRSLSHVRRCRRGSAAAPEDAGRSDPAVVTIGDDGSVNDGPDHDPDVTLGTSRPTAPSRPSRIGGPRPAEQRWAPPGGDRRRCAGRRRSCRARLAASGRPTAVRRPRYPPPPPDPGTRARRRHAIAPSARRAPGRPGGCGRSSPLLALVVGTVGGVLGGIGYSEWNDDSDDDTAGIGAERRRLLRPRRRSRRSTSRASVARVAQEVLPSTVQIIAEFEGVEAGATGSGFVLDDEGHIVTNNHVVADAAENDGPIEIVDQDGNRQNATVVGRSPVYDLAVLHVAGAEDLKPASLGKSQDAARRRARRRDRRAARAELDGDLRHRQRPEPAGDDRQHRRTTRRTSTRSRPTPRSTPATRADRSSTCRARSSA